MSDYIENVNWLLSLLACLFANGNGDQTDHCLEHCHNGLCITDLESPRLKEFPFTACKETCVYSPGVYIQTKLCTSFYLMVTYHHLHYPRRWVTLFLWLVLFMLETVCCGVLFFSFSSFLCDSLKIFFSMLMVMSKSLTSACVKKTSHMELQPRLSVAPLNTLPLRSVNN